MPGIEPRLPGRLATSQTLPEVPALWGGPFGGAVGPRGASCLYEGHPLNEILAQDKIYIIFVGNLLGWSTSVIFK
jgi:hypothetical protein